MVENINPLDPIPSWKLRLQMVWSALTNKYFFFVSFKKLDWSGKGEHKNLFSGSKLPPDYKKRKIILETLKETIDSVIKEYDRIEENNPN